MNFLAHCALAHDAAQQWDCDNDQRQGLLAGAIIGDFVKGPIPIEWPQSLQAGARLHRKIDALSNQNPHIRVTCNRFPAHLRRFAPIFVDMLADHALALEWHTYYDEPIAEFTADCYDAIAIHADHLSSNGQRFFTYMRDTDLLANYDQWHHIDRGLASVLRRLNRMDMRDDVNTTSRALTEATASDFGKFYPSLRAELGSWNAFDASGS